MVNAVTNTNHPASSTNGSVIALDRASIPLVVPIIARAFEHDPMFTYIFPDSASRYRLLQRFFRPGLDYGIRYGVVHTTTGFAGAALWLRPEQPGVTLPGMVRTGMLLLPLTIGIAAFRRFLAFVDYAEACHKQIVHEPHWYLLNLGVDPSRQGQGVGNALMQPVFEEADTRQLACYLETNTPRNIRFYEKRGFQVAHYGQVPHGGPEFYALIRPPQRR